ncbi:C4-dicarboxylate ABC transporter substrate-binding protein [Sporanaerobium hydrogeniformans]|uniref:C4-dicarboxylate ABC transporter substrate-binding protein n=1 Tax=Sporanaerobium hydrogeniformans TaxID=3072179 RepID=A0AC61DD93_9FIRM|nr:TRAP transporter substrate-binding protein [Sporanaerobium hydrogeniformans]PHV70596.1 C4-dicarboxylate ABC transporter substrate-binding protein [Sporanaerobium hydrogeniformans]
MKKKIALLMAGMLTLATLTGCGGGKSPAASTPKAETEVAEGAAAVKPEINLIVAHNQTSLENPYAFGIKKFKEVAEEVSGGKISVTLHNGTLGENESELIEKLTMGAASMVVASPGFMTAIGVPEVDMFSLLYLFDSFDHWEKAVDGEFGNAMKNVIAEKTGNQFRVMGYWSSGVRDVYGKKAIKTPADAKGLTIRTQSSSVQQEFWSKVGAVPTSVAWGELYQALQQNVVDSAENDYTSFMLKEHHKTDNGKYVSETHHDYTTRLLLMDGNFYDSLTEEQKGWIDTACVAATEEERSIVYKMAETSKEKVIADGASVTENADMDIEAFKAIAIPIQEKFVTDNKMENYLELIRTTK